MQNSVNLLINRLQKVRDENTSSRFQFARLATLTPSHESRLPRKRQEQVLAKLRANPAESYAFFGPAGTGKTTLSVALYRDALRRYLESVVEKHDGEIWYKALTGFLPVWRVSAKNLLEDFVRESRGETENGKPDGKRIHPVVSRAHVRQAVKSGFRPCLFLDEIDKVKYTEFKANALFEVVDAIYEAEGQLVFDTNLTKADLATKIGAEVEPEVVASIFRRIGDGNVYDFFTEEGGER